MVHLTETEAVRFWLARQGLARPRGELPLTAGSFTDHLERTGALQLDSINVVERAHYLTLWSRFGAFARSKLDRWIYRERRAYEYWGHEASLLPISHLPLGLRRMRDFPPESWTRRSWWSTYATSTASRRRVLKRIREEGPLEAGDFELGPDEFADGRPGGSYPLTKEDGRSLKLLWHEGKLAVHDRRHFRCVYDLAERVYPDAKAARARDAEDSWLLIGLSGNGVAPERHLVGYWTAHAASAAERKRVLERALRSGRVTPVKVGSERTPWYMLSEHLDALSELPEPEGTTLLTPFDSLLWQRKRAEELLGFRYRVEIYVPAAKREFGYYALPILHDGRLVGRLDPKLHRDRGVLEVRSLHLEPSFKRDTRFARGVADALDELRRFLGAEALELPRGAGWV
ncbi:MAG: crosslink repair DNA glycosylase YcaQ family protein [Gemmatimonadota bacterium]